MEQAGVKSEMFDQSMDDINDLIAGLKNSSGAKSKSQANTKASQESYNRVSEKVASLCDRIGIAPTGDTSGIEDTLDEINDLAPNQLKKLKEDLTIKLAQTYEKVAAKKEKWQKAQECKADELGDRMDAIKDVNKVSQVASMAKEQSSPTKEELVQMAKDKMPVLKKLPDNALSALLDENVLSQPIPKKKFMGLRLCKDSLELGTKLLKNLDELGNTSTSVFSPNASVICGYEMPHDMKIDHSTFKFLSTNEQLCKKVVNATPEQRAQILKTISDELEPPREIEGKQPPKTKEMIVGEKAND